MFEPNSPLVLPRLFPELADFRLAHINLDEEARRWVREDGIASKNPLLDPETCLAFVDDCNRRLGTGGSYGGWLEDRRALWRGSYLDADERYVHLGIDLNVPAGTAVALPRRSKILLKDDDFPEPYGWGARVIVRPEGTDVAMIFAHLSAVSDLRVGDTVAAKTIIGRVGTSPHNGGWFPHLHVQLVALSWYEELLKEDLRDLDGYANPNNLPILAGVFPNPLPLLVDG